MGVVSNKALFKPTALIVSPLFAATLLVAYGLQVHGSILPLFNSTLLIFTLAAWLGLSLILYGVLCVIFAFLDNASAQHHKSTEEKRREESCENRQKLHSVSSIFLYAGIILIWWLPVLIIFFPGTVAADGYWQIDYYWLGEVSPTDIHPPFSTYLLGLLYFTGESLGGTFGGVLLASLVQLLLALGAYTCVCVSLERGGLGRKACLATACFYGLVPLFCNAGMTVFKDSYYLSLFVLFVLALVKTYRHFAALSNTQRGALASLKVEPLSGVRQLLPLVILGLLLCCFRKEAVYLVVASIALVGLVFARRHWPRFLAALIAYALGLALLGQLGLTTSAVNDRGVSLEMASIPLQQTARYVRDAPNEVTPEEQAIIDQVFVYDADTPIAVKYDPELSDNVKGFNTYIDSAVFSEYLKTYLAMGSKHPEIYLDAFLHQTYGYYSPAFNSTTYYAEQSTGFGSTEGRYVLEPSFLLPAELREGFQSTYLAFWQNVLPFSLLWNAGFALWVLVFLAACLLRKRRFSALAVFVPVLLIFAICLISPVNGNLRYAMPYVATLPLLAAFAWQELCCK